MATVAEDESLPTHLRSFVIRDKRCRPTGQSLLRIIRSPCDLTIDERNLEKDWWGEG